MRFDKVKLGELLNFRRGHDLPKTKMQEGLIPVVGSNGVIGFHNKFTTRAPLLSIGRSGNIGNPFYLNKDCWAHNTTLYVDDFKGNVPRYLYYLLKTLDLSYYGGGSAVPTLNRNYIHPLMISATSDIKEQKAIAATLSCLDDKIELNNRMNDTLEQMAQALFKSWFVDFEPFQDGEFEDSELGKIPKGWKVGALSELFEFKNGKKRPQEDGKYPVYGGNGILGYSAINNNENIIAIGRVGAYCGSLYFVPGKCWISDNAIAARSRQNSNIFCYYTLKYLRLNERRIGTGQPLLTQGILNNILFVIPKVEYISGFDERMDSIFKQIYSNKRQNKFLSSLRDNLLPKLMSGEIRVPVESAG